MQPNTYFTERKSESTQTLDRLISTQEAARILGISTKTVERRAAEGAITPIRLGRLVRYRYSEVLRIVETGF